MNFSPSEQGEVEEMVRLRSVDRSRPPWMQPHRFRLVQKEARRRIGELPPPPPSPTRRSNMQTPYHAERRVTRLPVGDYAIHESDGHLPICHLGDWFAEKKFPLEQLGPGQVDCGHCGWKNA